MRLSDVSRQAILDLSKAQVLVMRALFVAGLDRAEVHV
jgi:hypothetical protein